MARPSFLPPNTLEGKLHGAHSSGPGEDLVRVGLPAVGADVLALEGRLEAASSSLCPRAEPRDPKVESTPTEECSSRGVVGTGGEPEREGALPWGCG